MDPKKTGTLINKLRKEKKLTQNELADLLQVTDKAISRWEVGDGYPDISILPKLATILCVSVDELLNGEKKEIIENGKRNLSVSFSTYSFICFIITVFGLLLSIAITYLSEDKEIGKWIGFIVLLCFSVGAIILYLIKRSQMLILCDYTAQDKILLYKATKLQYFTIITAFFFFLPLVIPIPNMLFQINFETNYINNISIEYEGIPFLGTYLVLAIIFGLIGLLISYIISFFHFHIIYKSNKTLLITQLIINILFWIVVTIASITSEDYFITLKYIGAIFGILNIFYAFLFCFKKLISKKILIAYMLYLSIPFIILSYDTVLAEFIILSLAGMIIMIIWVILALRHSNLTQENIKVIFIKNILFYCVSIALFVILAHNHDYNDSLLSTRIITLLIVFSMAFSDIFIGYKTFSRISNSNI